MFFTIGGAIIMEYRTLGKTGLKVSEIGFGGEWLERHGLKGTMRIILLSFLNMLIGKELT